MVSSSSITFLVFCHIESSYYHCDSLDDSHVFPLSVRIDRIQLCRICFASLFPFTSVHPNPYIITQPPQQPPRFSPSLISIFDCGPFDPNPGAPLSKLPDICLLYLRISRTISQNALSTLMRDFADVSMNLQPNCLASDSPSAQPCQRCSKPCGMAEICTLLRNLSLTL